MGRVARRHGEPWFFLAEPGIRVGVPLHGGAFAVAADLLWPSGPADRIFHVLLALRVVVLHAQFFAVIHDRRATQCQVESAHQLRDRVVVLAIAVAIEGADLVVVADDVDRPSAAGIHRRDLTAEFGRRQFIHGGEHEVHRHLQLVVAVRSVVCLEFLDV